jgi:hypothetical protein
MSGESELDTFSSAKVRDLVRVLPRPELIGSMADRSLYQAPNCYRHKQRPLLLVGSAGAQRNHSPIPHKVSFASSHHPIVYFYLCCLKGLFSRLKVRAGSGLFTIHRKRKRGLSYELG